MSDAYGLDGGFKTPSAFGSVEKTVTPARAALSSQNRPDQFLNRVSGMANRTSALGDTMQAQGTGLLNKWGGRVDSAFNDASSIASREPSWYADRAGVTSNQAFDESKGVQDRALSRMGINPNSGRFVGLQTQWGLARAAAEAGARTRAAQDSEATRFSRLQNLLGVGNQGLSQGANMLSGAGGAYSRAAGDFGDISTRLDKQAEDAATWDYLNKEKKVKVALPPEPPKAADSGFVPVLKKPAVSVAPAEAKGFTPAIKPPVLGKPYVSRKPLSLSSGIDVSNKGTTYTLPFAL